MSKLPIQRTLYVPVFVKEKSCIHLSMPTSNPSYKTIGNVSTKWGKIPKFTSFINHSHISRRYLHLRLTEMPGSSSAMYQYLTREQNSASLWAPISYKSLFYIFRKCLNCIGHALFINQILD